VRLTLRTTIVSLTAVLVSACSSLGGVELQDGAEGRFTAGDDGDPTGPVSGGAPHPEDTDDTDGSSGFPDDPGPLEPPPGTDGTDGTTSDDAEDTGQDSGTESSASADDGDSSGDGIDDGTTSDDPQTNGIDSAGGTTGDTDACTELECLPVCEGAFPEMCDQQCDDVRDAAACVTEGGIVVSCDMGVWACAD
jgi:hypothetical protein